MALSTRHVVRLANPSTTRSAVTDDPVSTAIILGAAIVAVQSFRDGTWPSSGMLLKDAVLIGGFLLIASFIPSGVRLLAWILLVALLYLALTNAPVIENVIATATRAVPLR